MREMFRCHKRVYFLELIAVLIVLAIMTAVAVSRLNNNDAEVVTGADTLKMHLRYAQTMAMNSNPNAPADQTVWGISCSGSSYWLFRVPILTQKQISFACRMMKIYRRR